MTSILGRSKPRGSNSRLREGIRRLEFWRTQDILRRTLLRPGGLLLDIGGGIHAESLPADGWDVELINRCGPT